MPPLSFRRLLRSSHRAAGRWVAAAVAVLLIPTVASAQIDVLTNRYDGARTGANLRETTLTTANVNTRQFGKLYSLPVDGAVYAQPLYRSGVTIGGARHNVLYVATMNDKVYAFDADSAGPPLWTRSFVNPPAVTAVPITDIVAANLNITGNVGIQSTPVIDASTSTMYLVARTKESGSYVQRLHALDIATGAERAGSPVTITGSAPGTAPDATAGAAGSEITFDPRVQVQRAALALSNGVVLVAWASHEDITPSHGWIMGFDSDTLAQVAVFAVAPGGYLGGVWQGGRAPAIDAAGNAYFATANGKWDGVRNFGNSLLKFSVSRTGLRLLDYFTPANEALLSSVDDDFGGSGFTLLPGTDLLLGGGKEGVLFLLNANDLGGKTSGDVNAVQRLPVAGGHVMGGVVYWNSARTGPTVYNWSEQDVLKAYSLADGRISVPPFAQGRALSPGHPGGSLTISANGATTGSGIVWASMPWLEDAKHGVAAGILRAYNAETLEEIWTSELAGGRDRLGDLMKFVPPVVANGKVYLPNHDNGLVVYGLLPAQFAVDAAPAMRIVTPGATATFTVTVTAQAGFSGTVNLKATGQPSGVAVSFDPPSIAGTGTALMNVSVPATAALGTLTLTVTGNDGTQTRSANAVTVNVSAVAPGSGSIAIDFVGTGKAMAAGETAGVVSQPFWNSASGAVRATPLALVDSTGVVTGATVTWEADNIWMTPITDGAGNRRMMKGYLDNNNATPTTVTIAGLALRTYDVYVYVDGDNGSYSRSGSYALTIAGGGAPPVVTAIDAANTNFSGTFVRSNASSGNYVKFTVTATQFTLTATPLSGTSHARRAPVNGIQIVPAVTPIARAIGVDFVGTSTAVLSATSVAGVVPISHWNNATGIVRSAPLPLTDETGAATTAAVTWSANNTWSLPITASTADRTMMAGYLDTGSATTTTVAVTGLLPATYDVYVYVDGDNRSYSRSASYTITGAGIPMQTITLEDAAATNFSGSFVQATGGPGNYVRFTVTGTAFTISGTPGAASTTTRRAPVNGIEIVPRVATP